MCHTMGQVQTKTWEYWGKLGLLDKLFIICGSSCMRKQTCHSMGHIRSKTGESLGNVFGKMNRPLCEY